jgi:hypothetical protein
MTFAGIRYLITSAIRIRGDIAIRIGGRRIPVADTRVIILVADVLVAVAGRIIRRVVTVIPGAVVIPGGATVIAITRRGVG